MTGIASALTTNGANTRLVNVTELHKARGIMVLPDDVTALNALIASGPLWAVGHRLVVANEPSIGHRVWNGTHARTFVLPNGATVLLGATGTVFLTTGAPASGTGADGDLAIDQTAKTYYGARASGVWPAAVSFAGAGVSTAATAALTALVGEPYIATPTTLPTAADSGSAGNLTGTYYYTVAFVTAGGSTDITTAIPTPVTVSGKSVNLTNIPVSTDPAVIARIICRNKAADGSTNSFVRQWQVATINNNTATTFTDNVADVALSVPAPRISALSGQMRVGGAKLANFGGISNGFGQGNQIAGTGYANTSGGANAMQAIGNGVRNTAFGVFSLFNLTEGDENSAYGTHSLGAITTASRCSAFGYAAGISYTGTDPIAAFGAYSLNRCTTGYGNASFGTYALSELTTGYSNAVLGDAAGRTSNSIGSTYLGARCGEYNSGWFNVAAGLEALQAAAGNFSVAMGHRAGHDCLGANCVFVGHDAGYHETGSLKFYLDGYGRANNSDERAKSLLYGEFADDPKDQRLAVNAPLKRLTTTVANLPSASTYQDFECRVTDANATTFNAVVAGGGTNRVNVTSDGTNWRIG